MHRINHELFRTNILVAYCILVAYSCDSGKDDKAYGPFMGMVPTETPSLLSPELIASPVDEYNGTFNPTGDMFYYTTNPPGKGIITFTEMDESGNWSEPKMAPFSANYSEYDPLFAPDGSRLYFSSERPTTPGGESGRTNIWYTDRTTNGWTSPQRLPLKRDGVYYSSLTNKGDIYFNIWSTGDMFKAARNETGYEIFPLDSILNSSSDVGDPFISPEEDYLIFRGYNNSLGQGDLYISFNIEESWTEPENLGSPINSSGHEMCPYVTVDGKFFIFASSRMNKFFQSKDGSSLSEVYDKFNSYDNGGLNIYYMSANFISEKKEKYLKKN